MGSVLHILILAVLCAGGPIAASPPVDCLSCHANDTDASIELPRSIHATLRCTECHERATTVPHPQDMGAVDCLACHEEGESYEMHGRMAVGRDADIPSCSSCHGTHDILPSTDPGSRTHPRHLATTCSRCHDNVNLSRDHTILRADHPVSVYRASVHGRSDENGPGASCVACHASDGSAHHIYAASDPRSSVNHFRVPETCGACHGEITAAYMEGIHGQLLAEANTRTPVCTHCHGEHGILPASDPRSAVSPTRLAIATCAPCHDSAALNERYGVPTGSTKSFVDTYHGLKTVSGDRTVANCASCHGTHRILPESDPRSSVHPAQLQTTCGSCHDGITETLARTPIHGPAADRHAGWPQWVAWFYQGLIAVAVVAMAGHQLLSISRVIRDRRRLPQVRRFTVGEVMQHAVLVVSFVALVLTGFSLRFNDAWWVRVCFGWDGGAAWRGWLHRAAAVAMLAGGAWHVAYLSTARGRQWLRDMWPRWQDVRDVRTALAYFAGRHDRRPQFRRFSYVEKVEYWALMWGTAIMAVTGFMLWFDNALAVVISPVVLDVALVVHYYEAWLAVLAILIWHLYAVIFNPDVYPMNPAWMDGSMPAAMYRHEHPLADDAP